MQEEKERITQELLEALGIIIKDFTKCDKAERMSLIKSIVIAADALLILEEVSNTPKVNTEIKKVVPVTNGDVNYLSDLGISL
jgi:uncharacterized protein (UPF0147 family)